VATLAIMALVGGRLLAWRRERAYRRLKAAVLVGLLVTQVFNFTDRQFHTVWELPFDLVVLAALSHRLRRAPGD
jgi:hypothetical protein